MAFPKAVQVSTPSRTPHDQTKRAYDDSNAATCSMTVTLQRACDDSDTTMFL
jgi:hypothetical protein